MSKLREIIHQYVVEALEEILDEENIGDTTHYIVTKAGHRAIMKSGLHEHPGVDYDPDNNRLSVTHYGGSRNETIRNGIVANHEKAGHLIKANTAPAPKNQARPMPMRSEGVEREARLQNSVLNDPTNQDKRDALERAVTKNVRRKVRAMRKRLFVPKPDDKYDD